VFVSQRRGVLARSARQVDFGRPRRGVNRKGCAARRSVPLCVPF